MKSLKAVLGITLAFLGLGVVGSASFINNKKTEYKEADAATVSVTSTRLFIEDKWGNSDWTSSSYNPVMEMYNITFVQNSGYSSTSDVKFNDMYANSFTYGDTWMHIEMKWVGDGGGSTRQYEAIVPWYIAGFKTKLYAEKNGEQRYMCNKNGGSVFEYTLSRGQNVSIDFSNGSWGGSSGSSYYTNDHYVLLSSSYSCDFHGIKSGTQMYLNTQDLTGWESDNAKLAIYFGKSNVHKDGAWSSQYNSDHTALTETYAWKVLGSGNEHLYECIVPKYNNEDVYFSLVIGVRLKSSAGSTPSWGTNDANIHNKTGDQFFNSSDTNCNMLWVNAATGGNWTGGGYLRTDKTISKSTRAGYYGTYFLSQITCSGSGSITSASSNWANVRNEYNQHLSDDVRGEIWNSTESASGTDLQKAMLRYDYIVFFKHYGGYDDFISRDDSTGNTYASNRTSSLSIIAGSKSSTTTIIVIVSLIGITAIGGYLFLKKKEESVQE